MERSSKWAFIVYPESAPADWKKTLEFFCIPFAVSPLHSPEPDSSGEQRKKHYHVIMDYSTLKSFEQVSNISKSINASNPIIINDSYAYYRYMIHLDNPEKEQFKNGFDSIEKFNGFDHEKFQQYSKKQIDAFFKDIIKIISINNITEYETLLDYLINNADVENFNIYFRIVRTNTIFFNTFLSSKRNRLKKQEIDNINNRILKIETKIKENCKNG